MVLYKKYVVVFWKIFITENFLNRNAVYPSPFIFSPGMPINTGTLRMNGKKQPFITLHLFFADEGWWRVLFSYFACNHLYIRYLCWQDEGWRVLLVSHFKFSIISFSNFQSIGLSGILQAWRQNLFFIKLLNKHKYHSAYAELWCFIITFAFKFWEILWR